ncbi:sigma-54 dependent transcriptional regulator [Geomonas nitrogeniifigens]|uniref:Sigma-54 dependent transcriptional regulator n=1 Tax=Geomonas diazotrophica TaxID=2843197 RepID=A0ABX8JCM6_9BACT|nr:sigma-54 dependent transcriptional regulator [Geomonas nitrogeniifigens]QWV96175.1 sigma-54 dependent transcriptional regulator [Geomonas nitrogeniifigens]QXE85242.1 sigma-54 dependent transcriptional regulator [Geomonas nitrogeniifigens]
MTTTLYPAFGILLVDDEPDWLYSMSITLERAGLTNILTCSDSREALGMMTEQTVGVVLLDLTMPHLSGEELLERIAEEHPEVTVIIISGLNQLETAVNCMRSGAFDYYVKTSEEGRIVKGVKRAVREKELQLENRELRNRFLYDRLEHPEAFREIVTGDKGMRSIFQYVEAVALSSQPILVTGESGVGKELIVAALHRLSGRKGELVAVNVAGLDDAMVSDTLFGHLKGAYTGAGEARKGMIEQAADGTLFLDEIGDLSLGSQVKLLRLLQEGEYYPIGSDRPRRIRARVVVATHQDLAARQAAGEFRKDLYYRLRAHHLHIPPLRKRKEDIPLLLDHFLELAAREFGKKKPTLPKELAVLLATYDFPGNVRELKAMVYDAVSLHQGGVLSMEAFVRAIGERPVLLAAEQPAEPSDNPFFGMDRLPGFTEAIDLLVAEAVRRAEGNQSIAARLLGVSQPTLSKRLKQQRS